MTDDPYPSRVRALFDDPPRAGILDGGGDVVTARATTPASRAVLQLQCRWRDGRIEAARFLARGCPYTVAVGAWLAGALEGRDAAGLAGLDAAEIQKALEIPELRTHCALLGADAVQDLKSRLPA